MEKDIHIFVDIMPEMHSAIVASHESSFEIRT